LIGAILATSAVDEAILGISDGQENLTFADVACRHDISCIFGDEEDVLKRLIQCGQAGAATDVFRITTESPFTAWEFLDETWSRHVSQGNDITATEYLPEGSNFEILTLEALERSHREGEDSERSEFCTAYPRRVPEQFQIEVMIPPQLYRRPDVRLTVDYPEDLILCRGIWADLSVAAPHVPLAWILEWVDTHKQVHGLVDSFVDTHPIWGHVAHNSGVPLSEPNNA
jgi:spore coat polysaccharide biosynthesis protein SpsF